MVGSGQRLGGPCTSPTTSKFALLLCLALLYVSLVLVSFRLMVYLFETSIFVHAHIFIT